MSGTSGPCTGWRPAVHIGGCVPGGQTRRVSVTLRAVTTDVTERSRRVTRTVQGGVYRCVPDVYRKNPSLRSEIVVGTHGTRVPENATSVGARPFHRGNICSRRGAVFSGECVPPFTAGALNPVVHRCGRRLWTTARRTPIDSAASLLLGCVAYPERILTRGSFA